jgi:hypothetical protein
MVLNSLALLKISLAFVTAGLQKVDNQMTCLSYLVVASTGLTHSLNKFVVEEG